MMDRVFDNYVMTPAGSSFGTCFARADRDPYGVKEARIS